MIKVMFICHGNICRSPMAEFIFKDLVKKAGLQDNFSIVSRATSREEIGNPVHPGTIRILNRLNIDCRNKRAQQITLDEFINYDYLIPMDYNNINNLNWMFKASPKHPIKRLLAYCGNDKDIADPWYTGDFETTYQEINEGCQALLLHLQDKM